MTTQYQQCCAEDRAVAQKAAAAINAFWAAKGVDAGARVEPDGAIVSNLAGRLAARKDCAAAMTPAAPRKQAAEAAEDDGMTFAERRLVAQVKALKGRATLEILRQRMNYSSQTSIKLLLGKPAVTAHVVVDRDERPMTVRMRDAGDDRPKTLIDRIRERLPRHADVARRTAELLYRPPYRRRGMTQIEIAEALNLASPTSVNTTLSRTLAPFVERCDGPPPRWRLKEEE